MGVVTSTASCSNKSLELAAPHASKSVELAASQSVRVRVENRLLLVPVPKPEQQTIGWLAREAARRYCRLVQVQTYLYITRDIENYDAYIFFFTRIVNPIVTLIIINTTEPLGLHSIKGKH